MRAPLADVGRNGFGSGGRPGYSLIELLIVMAVVGVAMGLVTVSFRSLQTTGLTTATRQFADYLNLCRSQAIAKHTAMRVGIVVASPVSEQEFRRFSTWTWNKKNRRFEQIHEWKQLSSDLSFAASLPEVAKDSGYARQDASAVRGDYWLSKGGAFSLSDEETIRFIDFSPSGRASTPDGDRKNLVLVLKAGEADRTGNLSNWAQFNIDTLTGRVRIYRP